MVFIKVIVTKKQDEKARRLAVHSSFWRPEARKKTETNTSIEPAVETLTLNKVDCCIYIKEISIWVGPKPITTANTHN
jgi:hypothetical protein